MNRLRSGSTSSFEVHGVRQAADVVVALDDGGLTARTALDDIGVNGTLCKEIDLADLLRLFLKDADELLADDLALALRLGDTGQLCKVAVTGVHADEVDVKAVGVAGAEDGADLFLLILRSRPWSTKTQVSCLPMALASMAASTEESTPPDRAQSTLPLPMRFCRASTLFSTKESIFQSPVQPQTLYTKLCSIFLPSAVWSTSGWN